MPFILIVDDSAVDRRVAGSVLEKAGYRVAYASNGHEALEAIAIDPPDAVVTDLMMPVVDGLELVRKLKASHRALPVVLMTAHGNEDTAVTALRVGAASYVPKQNLAKDLEETIRNVFSVAAIRQAEEHLLEGLKEIEIRFELRNDTAAIRPLVMYVQSQLRQMRMCDETDIVRISTALQEALVNAIEHGNLELDSNLREDMDGTYSQLARDRSTQPPYANRRVFVAFHVSRDEAAWVIRDEGPGFDPSTLPDPRDPANLQRVSGRGLLLIRTFMDEVTFNETANEIRMVKRAWRTTGCGCDLPIARPK